MTGEPGEYQPDTAEGQALSNQLERELAAELLSIHEQSYGRGASEAHVEIFKDTVILILDGLELLPNEQFLVDKGKGESVIDVRGHYQQAIETTFRAAVERATGRRVVSFASVTKLSPNYAVEIFRLGKETQTPLSEP